MAHSEQLADLQQAVSDYRDMLSRCDDLAECDRLLELIAECDKQIAKLVAAPVADSEPRTGKREHTMASNFTPKQLNITPALGREKAEARLTVYGDRPENFAIKQAWYLVQHTDVTGRMNGEGALAYRRLSGYQLAKLVCEIANQNIMGADVTAYMYKFLGISLEVAVVASEPLADADIPFATGMDDNSPCIAEPPVNPIWTHTTRPAGELVIPRYFNQRMCYVPVALRNHQNTPQSAFKAHSAAKTGAKVSTVMMQRNKPLQAQIRANYRQQIERRNLAMLDMLSRIHVVNQPVRQMRRASGKAA